MSWETYHSLCTQNSHKQLDRPSATSNIARCLQKSLYTACKYPACGWTSAWMATCGPWTTLSYAMLATPRSCAPWKPHTNTQWLCKFHIWTKSRTSQVCKVVDWRGPWPLTWQRWKLYLRGGYRKQERQIRWERERRQWGNMLRYMTLKNVPQTLGHWCGAPGRPAAIPASAHTDASTPNSRASPCWKWSS
jgi:hypothetical protein